MCRLASSSWTYVILWRDAKTQNEKTHQLSGCKCRGKRSSEINAPHGLISDQQCSTCIQRLQSADPVVEFQWTTPDGLPLQCNRQWSEVYDGRAVNCGERVCRCSDDSDQALYKIRQNPDLSMAATQTEFCKTNKAKLVAVILAFIIGTINYHQERETRFHASPK